MKPLQRSLAVLAALISIVSGSAVGLAPESRAHPAEEARRDGARVDRARIAVQAIALADCVPNAGKLLAPPMAPAGEFTVFVSHAQAPGALAFLAVTAARTHGVHGCGFHLAGIGWLQVDLSPGSFLFMLPASAPAGALLTSSFAGGTIPADPALAGVILYAQGMWLDPTPAALEPVRLTDALQIQFAP